jgi:hypothetical protein
MKSYRKNWRLSLFILATLLLVSCNNTPSLSDQLRTNFSYHVKKIDSAIVVDTFKIIKIDSITERKEQIMYDSMYSRERAGLENQLASASKDKNTDSIEFVHYEINFMNEEMDSMTTVINNADTINKKGVLIFCSYTLTKNNKSRSGPVFYFINNSGNIMNSDMIEDFINRSADLSR